MAKRIIRSSKSTEGVLIFDVLSGDWWTGSGWVKNIVQNIPKIKRFETITDAESNMSKMTRKDRI